MVWVPQKTARTVEGFHVSVRAMGLPRGSLVSADPPGESTLDAGRGR